MTPGAVVAGDGTGVAVDAAIVDPAVVDVAQVCDVDTGACAVAAGGPTPGVAAGVGASIGAISPTVLNQESGWGTSIGLMVLVIMLTLGLVLAPAVLWRRFSQPAAS